MPSDAELSHSDSAWLANPLLDAEGRIVDAVQIIDLDASREPASDRIRIGVATSPVTHDRPELDLILAPAGPRSCVVTPDPAGTAAQLQAAVNANPQAALVLAQVLRATEGLDPASALDVESFAYSTLLGGPEFRRWLAGRGQRPLPPPATAPPVLIKQETGRLRITLNRPERRNAYGRELRDAFADALRVAAVTPGKIVIDAAGPAFCAGGDLDEFGTAPDLVTAHFVRTRGGAGALLHRIAERVEVRVHGACVGAGIELPAFAGRVVARPDATFRLPEVSMGLIPGAGGTVSLPRRIGRQRTLYLALSGIALDAGTAAAWGLVDEISAGPCAARPRPG